jgi:hypothetical protein
MAINANIKADTCSCAYSIHFLRGCRGVFRDRHLQFVLSVGGYFNNPVDKCRKRTNTGQALQFNFEGVHHVVCVSISRLVGPSNTTN